ncbi:MAG TPA: PLP-dependent aminotransferase family protein [Rhodanobacteraceae bacterium]|nr:PLP-dependent aminotransferase family protein [Rhodanobacteraceae bacterium]
MRRWALTIALDPQREQPLFLQLAAAIAEDIRRGRLKAGDALPGSRELADLLGVNRNTVVAGYGELVAEGLLCTRVGGGTFVASAPATAVTPVAPSSEFPTYALAPPAYPPPQDSRLPPDMLMLSQSIADVRLFPARALARAFRRAIGPRSRIVLGQSDARGHPRLRKELSAMLARSRALAVAPDNLMITRSIEQAIDLVARTLIAPGDAVAVEAFGYPPARSVLKMAGARLLPIPLDEEGMDVAALEALLKHQRLRAVIVTPYHQFPTTAVMSRGRRERLAELSLQHGFAIIEDDYDHEFHYEGKPVLPIAAGHGRGNVVYVGSLANLLAPGISTGFVVAPPPVFERLAGLRAASDARGDAAMECAIAELFEDGELLRHVRRTRRTYAARRDAFAEALKEHLGSALSFRIPEGGMALWARADAGIDVAAWAAAGEREGVQFKDARTYDFFNREQPFLRLGFSYHDEAELREAAARMARALTHARALRRRPPAVAKPRVAQPTRGARTA